MSNKINFQNNTDFQMENATNKTTGAKDTQSFEGTPNAQNQLENEEIDCNSIPNKIVDCNTIMAEERQSVLTESEEKIILATKTEDSFENSALSQNDNTEEEKDTICSLDKGKYEKMKNWFFGCIPFILASIVISLFNIGKVRQPLSFLLLALGLVELAISNFVVGKKIAKMCTCKKCIHQNKMYIKYAIIYGVAAIGLLGVFIFYMVK